MAEQAYSIVGAFQACGIDAALTPPSNPETVYWGRKYTSGKECYPCILTTGDMVRIIKSPDFDRQQGGLFHALRKRPLPLRPVPSPPPSDSGRSRIFRCPDLLPHQDEHLYRDLGMLGKNFTRLAWQGMVAMDLLDKKLRETRPYEKTGGETEKVFHHYKMNAYEVIRNSADRPDKCISGLVNVLKEARDVYERIETVDKGTKPRIGIVGEIYIRSNLSATSTL